MALSQNNNHTFVSGELVTSAKLNSTKHIQTDTEANNDGFTGNPGQLTYDSTNKKLRLHDGTTAGGLEVTPAQGVSLGAGSVTENMLATGAVTDTKLATDSVTEEKISDGAVTASKLASDAISLGAGSVTSEMLADGAIESIDDIGDVQTTGTNHAPSDGDALIWNNSDSRWMPGSPFSGGNIGARAILHAVRTSSGGSVTPFQNGPRAVNQASVTQNGGMLTFTFSSSIQDPLVMVCTGGYGRASTSSQANQVYNNADIQVQEISISNNQVIIAIQDTSPSGTNNIYMPYLEYFAIVF